MPVIKLKISESKISYGCNLQKKSHQIIQLMRYRIYEHLSS